MSAANDLFTLDTAPLAGAKLSEANDLDQRIVRLVEPLAGQYCSFEAGELVKVKPSTRAGTTTVERATWRNSLTISNVLAYVPSHLVCTEPNAPHQATASDFENMTGSIRAVACMRFVQARTTQDYHDKILL